MKHFLKVGDLTKAEIKEILKLSKNLHQHDIEVLKHKNILFSFEKPSLRTKVGTEVAINQLGGKVIHIDPVAFLGGQVMHAEPFPELKERESLKDTVMNVSQWCDAIFVRVFDHKTLETLAKYSTIPIINGLCDQHHPLQALADMITIQEKFGEEAKVIVSFIGDANNVSRSLIEMGLMLGHKMVFAGPESCAFDEKESEHFHNLAKEYGGTYYQTIDPIEATKMADVVYADAFVSMGEEGQYNEKLALFEGYQINQKLFSYAKEHTGFMHCLPAHRGQEVTDEIMDHKNSWVYEQAHNRMVAAKGAFAFIINHNETNINKKKHSKLISNHA